MIVEWFTDFVLGLFGQLVALVPFPEVDVSGLAPAFGVMATFDALVPVTEAMLAAGLVLGVTAALFLYRIIKVALSHVPLIGGAG